MRRLLPLLALAACSEATLGSDGMDAAMPDDTAAPVPLAAYVLQVEPARPEVGGREVLPQRFGPYLVGSRPDLVLAPSVRLRGTLTGERLDAWALAPLPVATDPVRATLRLVEAGGRAQYVTRSDPSGAFDLTLTPGLYRLAILPDEPWARAGDHVLQVGADTESELRLALGAPIWGRVRDASFTPVPGAVVQAVREDGVESASAVTDDAGWYEVRVEPGSWRVITSEPPGERRPTLTGGWQSVTGAGVRVDVAWAAPRRVVAQLRVLDADGEGARDVALRLTSQELVGYAADEASYVLEVRADGDGFVEVRLPEGTYTVEALPGLDDPERAPLQVFDVPIQEGGRLPPLRLPGFRRVTLEVRGPADAPLVGATVRCTERIGQARTWVASSGSDGRASLRLPEAPLACVAEPPGDRLGLAAARLSVAHPADLEAGVTLSEGIEVAGEAWVELPSGTVPASLALVRVLDLDGALLGQTLADDEGAFRLRVDPRELTSP